jgi:hypothetical protein
MYLILIIRLTSSCFLSREGFQGNRRFPEINIKYIIKGGGFRGNLGSPDFKGGVSGEP